MINNLAHNKIILCFFTFAYVIFSIYVINQYSIVLGNVDFYNYFLGDGSSHISLINKIDAKLNLNKIHNANLYNNNYYIFSLAILKLLKIFPGSDYTLVGISAIIVNLISIYTICITCYLICYNLSKSKLFSIGIVCLLWNRDLLNFSLSIYPEVLQLALIFLAVYFVTSKKIFKWFYAFFFCGLAFGVKGLGLLIFIYLISFYFINEIHKNFKYLNTKIFITILSYTFFYSLLFLITFFSLNQLDPFKLFKIILSTSSIIPTTAIKEYDNSKIAYIYFIYLLREKTNFIIFLTAITLNFFLLVYKKQVDIFFYVTLFFLALFYYHITGINRLIEGPRYLYHLLPCFIILISLAYKNIRDFFNEKKLKIISLLFALIIFGNGLTILKNTFSNVIQVKDYKSKIKNDDMIKGYNFFKENITSNKKNPLVCAGRYSVLPMNFSKNIRKSYNHLDYDKDIRNKNCEFIVLDSSTPGRYIWFNQNLDNLIIRKYASMGSFIKMYGKEKIERTQELIKYLLQDPESGYLVKYYNSKIIILTKK